MPPDLSVIIPTYNGGRVLRGALEALRRQDAPLERFEIIVVDDGSTDGSVDGLEAPSEPAAIHLIRQANRGRAVARNRGAAEARGRVLLFLDADIWAEPGLVSAHLAQHDGTRNLGVQGQTLQHPESLTTLFMRASYITPDWTFRRPEGMSPYHVITRNFSVDAEAFRRVGGFDEGFEGYGWEDIELGLRLNRDGVALRYDPAARAYHFHIQTLEEATAKQVQSGRGAVYFWEKHRRSLILGLFLEIHPALLPFKWLIFRSGLVTGALRPIQRIAERAGLTLICSEVYAHLLWRSYYQGVFEARRRPR